MHWSETIARQLIERQPDKPEYVCAAGISPSGSVHIGNFRDIATSYFVCRALRRLGKRARLLFSWDDFDRLRKIPVNVAEVRPDMEQQLGRPYSQVPDPWGCCESYAAHFEAEFERSLSRFGIPVDFRYQTREYLSGRYAPYVMRALAARGRIFDILDQFRTQQAAEGEREAYYPVSIYCPVCGRDDTTITALSDDCATAAYTCACGHGGTFDFRTDFHCKLAWKIDWAMRWMVEGVDFEPGGKDHASPTGSYQTSRILSREIFGREAPLFQGYEFIGIKGTTGKMSGSTGLNLTPDTLLRIYQPEVILWLYARTEPTKAFDFCFDDEILRQYFEFDKMLCEYRGPACGDYTRGIMDNVCIEGREVVPVPMQQVASFGSIVDFRPALLEEIFRRIGTPYTADELEERLTLARYWMEQCSPQSMTRLREERNWAAYQALSAPEQRQIVLLHDFLAAGGYDLDQLNTFLYAVPEQTLGALDPKEKKKAQASFFRNVYQLLTGKDSGPRLYLFLYALQVEDYLPLLDFAGAQPPAGTPPVAAPEQRPAAGPSAAADAFVPAPIKAQITLDDFDRLDLRVCRVLACEEVKKSRRFLKLTLFDGLGERTIMSTLKGEYQPDELVGRKIIVVANLKPARFSGVDSQGMLLAGADAQGGCRVLFVDDALPCGSILH